MSHKVSNLNTSMLEFAVVSDLTPLAIPPFLCVQAQPRVLRFTFSKANTSARPPMEILHEMQRVRALASIHDFCQPMTLHLACIVKSSFKIYPMAHILKRP